MTAMFLQQAFSQPPRGGLGAHLWVTIHSLISTDLKHPKNCLQQTLNLQLLDISKDKMIERSGLSLNNVLRSQ